VPAANGKAGWTALPPRWAKYSVDNEARRDIKLSALRKVKE
jgi:hypothetical protein